MKGAGAKADGARSGLDSMSIPVMQTPHDGYPIRIQVVQSRHDGHPKWMGVAQGPLEAEIDVDALSAAFA